MLNSLCFTPGTCEVIHNRAGIIKSLCWYKTVEGEKQSRNTRDVCWRRDLELPGQRKAERIQELQILLFVPSRLAGRGASLVIAGKHLQINNPVIKGNNPVWWEGEEQPGLCCTSVRPQCLQALLVPCRRTDIVHFAALSLCPAGAAVVLLSFISSLQGARNELVKCSQYLKQGTLQPCLECSLG